MEVDKGWMQLTNKASIEYRKGLEEFMKVAHHHRDSSNRTRCLCRKCNNVYYRHIDEVHYDLYANVMDRTYTRWYHHGETDVELIRENDNDGVPHNEVRDDNVMQEIMEDLHMGTFMDTCVGEPSNANGTAVPVGEASSCHDNRDREGQLDKFTRLLRDLECELYSVCQKYSKLSFLVKLLHIKLINGWSNNHSI